MQGSGWAWLGVRGPDQQNVVRASWVVHVLLPAKYSCAVSAVSPARQDPLATGSICTDE